VLKSNINLFLCWYQ